MRTLLMLIVWAPLACLAQEMPRGPQQSPADPLQPAGPKEAPSPDGTITVPAGTRVQLALAGPIRTRDAHVGDIVHAVTNFPVTAGQDLAIPQGTYVEGRIARVGKRGSTVFDGLQIEFNQLVFSNGDVVALDGPVAEAKAIAPVTNSRPATGTPVLLAKDLQQAPTPPPLPQVGPPKGPIIAASLGGMAAFVVASILFRRHHIHEEPRDFDTGFQFAMVLKTPLTLDRARVAAALGSSGN